MRTRNLVRIPKITTIAMLALIAAGCDNQAATNDMSIEGNLAGDAAANDLLGANDAAAMPTDAAGFAAAVAASDLFEIESGKLAADKAGSADLKAFGKKLATDHQNSTTQLKTAAQSANVPVAPALDAEKQGMLDQLKAASGAEFDRLFVQQQKAAHQKALSLLQGYAGGGDNPALKGFATTASKVVQGHLDHVNGMAQ